MGTIPLKLSPYHKIAYDGKWASAVKAAGRVGWTEEATPTGNNWPSSTGLRVHLPFVKNYPGNATKKNAFTYEYRNNVWFNNTNQEHSNPLVTTPGIGVPLTNNPAGPNMAMAGTKNSVPLISSINAYMIRWGFPTGMYSGPSNSGMGIGDSYTMSFWVMANGASLQKDRFSDFEFGMNGDKSVSFMGTGMSGHFGIANTAMKLEAYSGTLILHMMSRGRGAGSKWNNSTVTKVGLNSIFPRSKWVHMTVNVSGKFMYIGMNSGSNPWGGSRNHNLTHDKAYGPWDLTKGTKAGSGANTVINGQSSDSPCNMWFKSVGAGFQISDFRIYNRFLNPYGRQVSHIRNHRNQFGDMPANKQYPTPSGDDALSEPPSPEPDADQSETQQKPSFEMFTSDLMGRMTSDGIVPNDFHQVAADFDATHGTDHVSRMLDLPVEYLDELANTSHYDLTSLDPGDPTDPRDLDSWE